MNKLYVNILVFCVAIFGLNSCNSNTTDSNEAVINATLKNVEEGQVVYLEDINGLTPIMIDTAKVQKSKIVLSGEVTSGLYRIKIPQKNGVVAAVLYLNSGDVMELDFDTKEPNNYKVNGNKDSQIIQGALKDRNDVYEAINKNKTVLQKGASQQQIDSINTLITGLVNEMSSNVKATIDANRDINPTTTALLVTLLSPQSEFQYISTEIKKCLELDPDSKFITKLAQQYRIIENPNQPKSPPQQGLAIGTVAPEINQPSPTGTNIPLSSLKGKYVLIDFWASWCRPCRIENPNVVRTYNKYKDKGFEVYSVSLDKSRDAWIKAIEKDGLVWDAHVSDLKAWSSQPARDYNTRSIPATYLLNPEGEIIAKNLRGPALEAKLAEVLN